jgi:pimeloyl-ACP methyl ester carboxylesterase
MASRILCNGVRLAVEDAGEGGPTVLFSHGLLYSLRMWVFRDAVKAPRWDD